MTYFAFKQKVQQDYGLTFGFDYNRLFQAASKSLGRDTTVDGVLRMFGQWTILGAARKTPVRWSTKK